MASTLKLFRDDDAPMVKPLDIYNAYPRKVGRDDALRAIEKAVYRVATEQRVPHDEAAAWLLGRVCSFARSKVVRESERKYVPYPATWFNAGRYHDDDAEWGGVESLEAATQRMSSTRDVARAKLVRWLEEVASCGWPVERKAEYVRRSWSAYSAPGDDADPAIAALLVECGISKGGAA